MLTGNKETELLNSYFDSSSAKNMFFYQEIVKSRMKGQD